MAYISLKKQNGPGGVIRQPGDHMPEADKWPNPKLWVSKGYVRWVEDAEVVDGRWKGFDAFVAAGQGGRALRPMPAGAVKSGTAPPPVAPAVPAVPDPRLVRLPLLGEYVAAGYAAEGYAEFLRVRTERATAEGRRVEVREPTAAEAQDLAARMAALSAPVVTPPAVPVVETVKVDPPAEPVVPSGPEAVADPVVAPPDTAPGPDVVAAPPKPPEVSALPARRELEKLQQPQLLALARARGLQVADDAGKGKLLKLLAG